MRSSKLMKRVALIASGACMLQLGACSALFASVGPDLILNTVVPFALQYILSAALPQIVNSGSTTTSTM